MYYWYNFYISPALIEYVDYNEMHKLYLLYTHQQKPNNMQKVILCAAYIVFMIVKERQGTLIYIHSTQHNRLPGQLCNEIKHFTSYIVWFIIQLVY